ncbi:hypothetical protein [Planctobacterium marinum]|uniref:hypothetical protein n=1 Tax=Planctobacterium marinum TaxID=1631968 RepID=UPI0030C6BE75
MCNFSAFAAIFRFFASLLLVLFSTVAEATESPHQWQGSASLGLENDSTVIIDELDTVVDEDSASNTVRLGVDYQYNPDDKNEWQFSGNYIVKNFSDSDDFDSALQIYSAAYSHEFERVTLGVRAQVIDSELNHEPFLKLQQLSPYVSFFIGKQWFVNFAIGFNDKRIETDSSRSAQGMQLNVDSYRFIQGINHYLLFSYKSGSENAEDPLFNQLFNQVRIGWVKKIRLFERVNKLRVNWRYLRRNYNDEIHPDIDGFRVDSRRQWEFEWELELNSSFLLGANYRLNEQDSNLGIARYDQHISSVSLEYRF